MLRRLIARDPRVYEALKATARRWLPLSPAALARLSAGASTLHQRYLQDFVFIHINKCGGTSLERALGVPLLNHDTALERRAKLGERRWRDRFKFAVVRDPYHRAASLFFYRHRHHELDGARHGELFLAWLEGLRQLYRSGKATKMEREQLFWVTDAGGRLIVDHLVHLERLDTDLDPVVDGLGRPIQVQRIKVNERAVVYHQLYTKAARELVHELWGDDFEGLGYARVDH